MTWEWHHLWGGIVAVLTYILSFQIGGYLFRRWRERHPHQLSAEHVEAFERGIIHLAENQESRLREKVKMVRVPRDWEYHE